MTQWSVVPLDSLAAPASDSFVDGPFGSDLKVSEYVKAGVPVLRLQNIRPNTFVSAGLRFITAAKARDLARHGYAPGDVVITKLGDPCGVACQVPPEAKPGIIVADVVRFRPDARLLDPRYLVHFLNSPLAASQVGRMAKGTTRQRVNLSNLKRIEVPCPALGEQRRIAAILDKADVIRRKRQQALQLTDELLRSAFLDIFGDPVMNQKGWPTATVEGIAPGRGLIVDGPFGSSLKPECYVPTGVRVIRNFNIKPGRFDGSEFKFVTPEKFQEVRRSEVEPGDILISTKGTIGNVCLMPDLPEPSLLSATGTVRVRVPHGAPVRASFLVAQMSTGHYRHYISTLQAGSNQQYLNLTAIRRMSLAIPPLALQDKYLQMEEAGRDARTLREHASKTISELFDCLVQRAFTGELSNGGTGSVGSTGVDE